MTGIIINNNEYLVNTGNTKIEYASMGPDTVGYSMYGDDSCNFIVSGGTQLTGGKGSQEDFSVKELEVYQINY